MNKMQTQKKDKLIQIMEIISSTLMLMLLPEIINPKKNNNRILWNTYKNHCVLLDFINQ